MFNKFVSYRLNNSKITFIMIGVAIVVGSISRFVIPKQYNPDIVVPAFQIMIPAPWYSSQETQELIVNPLERKLKEIEWVEHIYTLWHRDYVASMVMFKVWTNKEVAFTRLMTKINSSIDALKPLGVQNPIIKPIDPDDIPVYTFALTWSWSWDQDESRLMEARNISIEIMQYLENIKEVWVVYIVGGYKNTVTIKLDPNAIEVKWTDVMQVYDVLVKNNIVMPWWSFDQGWTKYALTIDANLRSIEEVKKLMITSINDAPIYLKDIATIYKGMPKETYKVFFNNYSDDLHDAVYIGVAKKRWTNAVDAVSSIQKELEKISAKLPSWYSIHVIQDEWKTAEVATNKLLHELFKSVIILFIVMFIFLWWKDALSSVFSIPLVLSITFGISLIIWDNINRITLFALILVLWMLVDDSIIVVENISRHLSERKNNQKSIIESILDATWEIWWAALFSTITKIIAFLWMFFVTGMMWQYMWPIPKYAIIALVTSIFIAFSINPFFSYLFAKNEEKKNHINPKIIKHISNRLSFVTKLISGIKSKKIYSDSKNFFIAIYDYITDLNLILKYIAWMDLLMSNDGKQKRKRKKIKRIFWITLISFFILLPWIGVFKRRMLPKWSVDQVYLWIDAPNNYSTSKTESIATWLNKFLKDYKISSEEKYVKDMKIISNISRWLGTAPMQDFANTFRGSMTREWENYISLRINLLDKELRSISSEKFVIALRPILNEWFRKNYPGVKMRLLEDPPWPPVKSTFMLKVSSNTTTSYTSLENISVWLHNKLKQLMSDYAVVDSDTTKEKYQTNILIKIDHEATSRAGLNAQQIATTLYTLFEWANVTAYHDETAKEPVNIVVIAEDRYKNFNNVTFTNIQWKKIPLKSIAKIVPTAYDISRYSDDWLPTVYIYWEMWNNSVIYPMISIISKFLDPNFWEWRFDVTSWNLYWFTLQEKWTDNVYQINFWGEWELSMDTFKDLWVALMLTLLWLYLLVSIRFKSFSLWGSVMLPFLLWFIWVLPWFSILYLLKSEYFSATSMIWVIALAGISVWNSIILLEYFEELRHKWMSLWKALVKACNIRLKPIVLTSITAILWAFMIIDDPVWSWLAWALIRGLSVSAILTLILVPIFVYDNQEKEENKNLLKKYPV